MRDYIPIKARRSQKKRSVKKGEVILKSEPFAYMINSQSRGQYCDHCLMSSR